MRWQGRQGSSNVDDRRGGSGSSGGRKAAGGIGIGSIIIVILAMIFGFNPSSLLNILGDGGGALAAPTTQSTPGDQPSDQMGQFVSVVLKETENTWNKIFRESYGARYREPVLVLFSGEVQSACGFASAATGPFYCPADQQVYIDLAFYDQLRTRFKAPGEFAMAYVVAHEVGHHIQNLLGYSSQVQQAKRRVKEAEANALSVRLELQADYLAGVWAHFADRSAGILEQGDIEAALRAAHAIGDDNIQKQSRGYVVPESFTHGTSEQRMRAFSTGYKTGDGSKAALDYFFQAKEL